MTLWGSRFSGKLDPAAWKLNASIGFDQRLALQDVRGSLAWANGLQKAGVIAAEEGEQIRSGLQAIQAEFEGGRLPSRKATRTSTARWSAAWES